MSNLLEPNFHPDPVPDPEPGPAQPSAAMVLLREFVDKTYEVRDLRAQITKLNHRLEDLDEILVEYFLQEGIESVRVAGTESTCYLRTQGWARIARPEGRENATPEDRARAVQALRDAGLESMIGLNHMLLSAYCREHQDDLPPEFEGAIEFQPTTKLCVMKRS